MPCPTPILRFLREYQDGSPVRLHMPGHKGRPRLGVEPYDITEIRDADSLYCPVPDGIIAQSEAVATELFGSKRTVYSAGGSSLCIFTAAWLLRRYAADTCVAPLVLAVRNVHQSFVSALAQTGLSVEWFRSPEATALACPVDAVALETHLRGMPIRPIAVYLTSPDYLGNVQPVAAIAEVCHRLGVLLLVDNAHGAYLHFLPSPAHPLDQGADIVCDSAHKTLPALTGAAYLHFGATCPDYFPDNAKEAMLSVASTSPSYLVLASLDRTNACLTAPGYIGCIAEMAEMIADAKKRLTEKGWQCVGDEPLKLTLYCPSMGTSGVATARLLNEEKVVEEYADRDYLILMASADTPPEHLERAVQTLLHMQTGDLHPPMLTLPSLPPRAMSVREAYFAPREVLPIDRCEGRVLAYLPVKCPPAVPSVIAGEELTASVLRYLAAQGYAQLAVVKPE